MANTQAETIKNRGKRNPIYEGKVALNGDLYDGMHEAIILSHEGRPRVSPQRAADLYPLRYRAHTVPGPEGERHENLLPPLYFYFAAEVPRPPRAL
jgi:hypothetical protein